MGPLAQAGVPESGVYINLLIRPSSFNRHKGLGFRASAANGDMPKKKREQKGSIQHLTDLTSNSRIQKACSLNLSFRNLEGGSWVLISRVISRVTIIITYMKGLINPLITTPKPPSSSTGRFQGQAFYTIRRLQ